MLDALGDTEGARAALLSAARHGVARCGAELVERAPATTDPAARIGVAQMMLDREDAEAAQQMLDELLARDDLSAAERCRAWKLRGITCNHLEDYDGAVGCYREALAAAEGTDRLAAGEELGFALWIADQNADAVAALDAVLAEDPARFWAHHRRGLALIALERLDDAEAAFSAALALDPCHVEPLCERGSVRLALGRVDDARADLAAAANLGSQEAVKLWREHELAGDLPAFHFDNAITCLNYGHNVTLAEGHYTRAHDGFLAASHAPGDWAWRHAAMALSNRAYCKLEQRRPADAVDDLRRAVEMRRGFRDAWNDLDNALKGTGKLAEAIAAYERCAACAPDFADAWYNRADAFVRLGRGDDAIAALDRAIAIGYPEGHEHRLRDAYYNRARAHQALGHWDAALADHQALAELGDNAAAYAADGVQRIAELVALGPPDDPDAFPFRFYGASQGPSVWEEYPRGRLRLQFAAPPSPDARAQIVRAIAEMVGDFEDEEGDGPSLEWADRFALITFPVADLVDAHDTACALVDAIHAIAPLVEVVAWHAAGIGRGPWEEWTVRRQPVPDPGPRFDAKCRFWVGAISAKTFSEPAHDDALDDAIAEAREREARAAAAEAAKAALARGEIALVPVDDTTKPPAPPPPRDLASLRRAPEDHVVLAPNGAGIVLRRHEGYFPGVARVTAAGEVHEVIPVDGELPILMRHLRAFDVRADGRVALVAKSDGAYEIDVETGAIAHAFDPRTPNNYIDIESVAYLTGDRIAIKTGRQLLVYSTDTPGGRPIAAVDTELGPITVHHEGRVVLHASVAEPNLTIYGLIGDRIERLAVLPDGTINPYTIETIGERIFCAGDCQYEIVNVAAAYARLEDWARTSAERDAAYDGTTVIDLGGSHAAGDDDVEDYDEDHEDYDEDFDDGDMGDDDGFDDEDIDSDE